MANVSKACCSGYQPKGEYVTINGIKNYVTGPETATEAILIIYDIFGFFDQNIQGAHSGPNRKYRVFMPDFFEGSPAQISWYPPQTEEHQKKLGEFFKSKAAPAKSLAKVPTLVAQANTFAPGGKEFDKWSVVGFCWGGKLATLLAGDEATIFKAAV
ncbi:Alpha/Beta hydrolase protein [Penicillium longicatenatum]|nr:Alpha/Beta hydrolase protein [Penicillium longicatenatum]